jgi:hypothetical protein
LGLLFPKGESNALRRLSLAEIVTNGVLEAKAALAAIEELYSARIIEVAKAQPSGARSRDGARSGSNTGVPPRVPAVPSKAQFTVADGVMMRLRDGIRLVRTGAGWSANTPGRPQVMLTDWSARNFLSDWVVQSLRNAFSVEEVARRIAEVAGVTYAEAHSVTTEFVTLLNSHGLVRQA